MKPIFFFRNDDVRDTLDDSLANVTNIFINRRVPITHAVEPANIKPDVAEWLLKIKTEQPNLIDISQHGFDHINKINTLKRKGEFGGSRSYKEQYDDIIKGKRLMDTYFHHLWQPIFNFPNGSYNEAAILAVNNAGFKILNSNFNCHWTRKAFYSIAHVLNKNFLVGYRVPYNLKYRPNTTLFEIDNSISFIKKYHSFKSCEFFTLSEMIANTKKYLKYDIVGVVLHHRFHESLAELALIENYLDWLDRNSFSTLRIVDIFEKYK